MSKNDGGPAYPTSANCWNGRDSDTIPGMTLRDAFAIAALPAIVTKDLATIHDSDSIHKRYKRCAQTALAYADAMLAEREK